MAEVHKAIAGVMTKFRISELSGVNSPAQKGARAVFMKRDDSEPESDPIIKRAFTDEKRKALADSGAALPDGSFPIEDKADLENAIRAFGRAKDKAAAKAHITTRAKALGSSDLIPESWASKSAEGGHHQQNGEPMFTAEIKKSLGLPETATDAECTAAIAKAATDHAALTKANERLTRLAKATPSDKKHMADAKMSDDDADDFLQKSDADRAAIITKAMAGDETLTSGGVSIRKSDVGEGAFAFMKAQAEALTKTEAAFAKAEEERKTAIYKSRAGSEMGYLTGTDDEHAEILKGIDMLPEAARAGQLNIIKAANETARMSFAKYGTGGAGSPAESTDPKGGALAKLDTMATELAKTTKVSFAKAYDTVCQANPQLYEAATQKQN